MKGKVILFLGEKPIHAFYSAQSILSYMRDANLIQYYSIRTEEIKFSSECILVDECEVCLNEIDMDDYQGYQTIGSPCLAGVTVIDVFEGNKIVHTLWAASYEEWFSQQNN